MQQWTVTYEDEGFILEGWAARRDDGPDLRPGVLLIHEYMGLGEYMLRHMEALTGLGCVVLAADMYGRGVRPSGDAEARIESHKYRYDRPLMRRRARAGLEALRRLDGVDPERLAAVGFSFGGCAALELARTGADLRGVVSYYGYLDTPDPGLASNISGKVLILHGALDPVVPLSHIESVSRELAEAGVDGRIIIYTSAGHGFANPAQGRDISTGNAYVEHVDLQARETVSSFLREVLPIRE